MDEGRASTSRLPKAVPELLGHSPMDKPMRYAHLSPDVKRDAVQLLDRPASRPPLDSGALRAPTLAGLGLEPLLTVRQVAELLAVCRATVYRLCAEGRLRHVRVLNSIRVRSNDLVALVQRAKVERSASA